jgi:hypothetical protein
MISKLASSSSWHQFCENRSVGSDIEWGAHTDGMVALESYIFLLNEVAKINHI